MPNLIKNIFLTALFFMSQSFSIAHAEFVVVDEFKQVRSLQQTPVWCWAAVIQMLLNRNGVMWLQPDIVAAVKGKVVTETATDQEISAFLNGWGFDYDGLQWKSKSIYKARPPKAGELLFELKHKRPIILKFSTGPYMEHVIVAYGVLTKEINESQSYLKGVFIFDPYSGSTEMIPGPEFFKKISGHWIVDVTKEGAPVIPPMNDSNIESEDVLAPSNSGTPNGYKRPDWAN